MAPMAGITDLPFRLMCRKFGADVTYTEMVSVDGLHYGSDNTAILLERREDDRPVVCQLFGAKPDLFKEGAKKVEEMGFDGVDINFGCPVRKVFNTGAGCALMDNLPLAKEVIQATCEAVNIPISIKIRAGIKDIDALRFLEYVKEMPISAVMIHGRTYEGGFSGKIDLDIIKKCKEMMPCPVLANGGINTPKDAKEMLEKTGADGLGIARGALGRPWIFEEIEKGGNPKEWEDIKKIALEHAELANELKGDWGIKEMRKHLAWYVKGVEGAAELRKKLVLVNNIEEVRKLFK